MAGRRQRRHPERAYGFSWFASTDPECRYYALNDMGLG